jgi:radical SAM protein with 4Fe4S-binding SPASM domain
MSYYLMRLNKYYDAIRTNESFFKTSAKQKGKILLNILKFYKTNLNKPLIVNNKPVVAQIEPTSLCNLRCKMCIREKIGIPIGTMPFEDFKKVLNKLDSLFKIHLSGQGEPFINKDLFKMIDYANKRGIIVNLNTNATLLNEEAIKKICDVNMGEIAVSFESTNKEEYEKIRRGARFEEVVENIKKLNLFLRKRKKRTIVSLAVTILKENIDELPNFVLFADKLGVKKIIAQTVQEKEDYVKNYNSDTKENMLFNYKNKLNAKVNQSKKIAREREIEFIFDEEKSNGCIWPWRSIYIAWDGNVTSCCKILNYKKDGMGNLLKEDFWSIWNGKKYQIFRGLLRKRTAPLPCKGCKMV